jgi:oxygen-independent coproporphyrinogen-3 oxidase
LEREHRLEDTIRSMEWARLAGFQNINLDLIFGLPRQQMSDWQDTLRHALGLRPEHLSLYPLTLEEGTRLRRAVLQGRHPWPDDDQSADMYIWAEEALEAAGFVHYEISNWARRGPSGRDESGFVCRHNLQYWRNLPYLGLGAGAHGYAAGYRYSNVLEPRAFMRRMRDGEDRGYPLSPAAADSERIGREEEMRQTMWLGLRLTVEGVAEMAFSSRFGASPFEVFAGPIQRLLEDGLLEGGKFEQRIRLTKRGRLLGNRVFIEFV